MRCPIDPACRRDHGWGDHDGFAAAWPYAVAFGLFVAWLVLLVGIGRGWF